MTKSELIEAFERQLTGGEPSVDTKQKFHPLEIEKILGLAYNNLVVDIYMSDPTPGKFDLDAYVKAYTSVAITNDATRDKYYANLPANKLVQIPNNHAIRYVGHIDDETEKYHYREHDAGHVFANLEVGSYWTGTTYYVEGEKIWLNNKEDDVDTIMVKIVIPFSEFEDSDDLPLPLGRDMKIFEYVNAVLARRGMQDKIIDFDPGMVDWFGRMSTRNRQ